MEVFSLNATTIPSSLTRRGATEKPSGHLNLSKYSHFMRYPCNKRPSNNRIYSTRARASGSAKSSAGTAEGIPEKTDSKDDNLVFVAGATGKVGSRTVRELIKLGFRVRAGVRNAQRAGSLVQSVKQLKLDATSEGSQAVEKLEIVECDLEKPDQIGSALGNASTVICSIGASEKEVFDITGPYRIDYLATKNLVDAATVAKVNHFILVTSLGTNKFGFPAAILNLFWGVLCWKRKAEEALLASGVPYTIVRPGGMERPTDAYKLTHNVTLSTEDTLFGGQVSNLQVAELMAVMAKNRDLSYCKIVEVIAETTAPLKPAEELLAKIPSQRPYTYPPKVPDTPVVSDIEPSAKTSIVEVEPSIAPQEETEQPKPVAKQPLSPYVVYDDLKPPSSPSPTQPSGEKPKNISDAVPVPTSSDTPTSIPGIDGLSETPSSSKRRESLSPYAAYEDLKPPTSPTPTPSTSNGKPLTASTAVESAPPSTEGNVAENNPSQDSAPPSTEGNVAENNPSQVSVSWNSPYHVYPDLKPPSSPSPNAPTISLSSTSVDEVAEIEAPTISVSSSSVDEVPQIDTVSSNGSAQLPIADEPKDEQDLPEPKSGPLSPYTMYEDLKPPASPAPSFRNP